MSVYTYSNINSIRSKGEVVMIVISDDNQVVNTGKDLKIGRLVINGDCCTLNPSTNSDTNTPTG